MLKKCISTIIKLAIIALVVFLLVNLYIEKIYNAPGAVAKRNSKAANQDYLAKLEEVSAVDPGSTIVLIDAYDDSLQEVAIATKEKIEKKSNVKVFLTADKGFGRSDSQRNKLRDMVKADYCIRLTLQDADGVLVRYSSTYYDDTITNADFAATIEREICDSCKARPMGIEDICEENNGWLEGECVPTVIVSLGNINLDRVPDGIADAMAKLE